MTALLVPSQTSADQQSAPPPSRIRRLIRGPADQPGFARPSAFGLLVITAVLYLWNLTASGYGNTFYAAAVQAGSQSWKAWLFGALDAGGAITVDKPPAALWVGSAFARLFGFSSFSVLAPQALMGVAAVALLYATVKRTSGAVAGLLAGAVLAVTPVAVLMFRFNNPDALLVLLMVAAAYCVVRAVEKAGPKWLALAGVAIGFAFLAKMMQAFLVLPAFALVYLVAAPTPVRKRLLHLVGALAAVVVSAGWYIALVELWPAASRPYIGGSTNNSLLELALGYNGLGRILGGDGNRGGGGGGGGGGNTGFGGSTGLTRMFGDSFGTEISWLLPAALIALVGGLWLTRRAPRTDLVRVSLLLWGGWLVVTALVFSYMSGTTHPYYAVALAPAIAGLIGTGVRLCWQRRADLVARLILAAMTAATGVWDYVLLGRTPDFLPWLRFVVLALGLVAAAVLAVGVRRLGRLVPVVVVTVVLALGVGSSAYAVSTASQVHSGSIPTSGPSTSAMGGGGGPGGGGAPGGAGRTGGLGGTRPGQSTSGQSAPGQSDAGQSDAGQSASGQETSGTAGEQGTARGGGGGGDQADSELASLLSKTTSTWAAATNGSQSAATLELASGKAVIGIGGWSGGDDAPTLAQFQQYVAEGKISYYVSGGQGGGGQGGSTSSGTEILAWVTANFTAQTVGSSTVYSLAG
ncbi:glycosyltransferase family 39 protein [Streptomyces sp. SID13031]|uniref:ArnT family glycosyltransferase n=1 Tax=Streptomyces sp. SID13031 TaxID=2706046 RepID=UPI0013C5C29B|nr:glycosyltransferase family 39 protein [Streptomyces sp. SID13031]NEA31604.1 glycosyltransferase family 39 protein [Streptomyces sp. SID13031]